MDQNQTPSFEIPKSPEAGPAQDNLVDLDPNLALEGTHEVLPAPQLNTQAPTASQPVKASPLATQAPVPVAGQPTTAVDDHLIADDVDVIEKEWVDRAKKIISLTSHDPHLEASELYKLKSVYMKKRFNKDLPQMPDGAD